MLPLVSIGSLVSCLLRPLPSLRDSVGVGVELHVLLNQNAPIVSLRLPARGIHVRYDTGTGMQSTNRTNSPTEPFERRRRQAKHLWWKRVVGIFDAKSTTQSIHTFKQYPCQGVTSLLSSSAWRMIKSCTRSNAIRGLEVSIGMTLTRQRSYVSIVD